MKRMFKVFLTVFVAFVAAVTINAATETGSITIKNTESGKTYELYKIFDLTYTGSEKDENLKVSYTLNNAWNSFFFGTNAPGSTYLVPETSATNDQKANLNPMIIGDDTYYINITDSNVAEFAQKALAYLRSTTPAMAIDESATGTGSDVTVNNLDLGYYLVYPKGASIKTGSNASICSLDSTTPSMNVNIKAEFPTIKKEVNDDNVDVGQTVTFTVTGEVPDTTGFTSYTYKVSDNMTAGLTFNKDVVVKFGTTNIATTGKITYTDPSDTTGGGFVLTFDMTDYQDYVGQAITITYTAVVNEKAVVTETLNTAKLTYSNDPDNPTNTVEGPDVTVEVHSSEITVNKYIKGTTTPLEGASFVLTKDVDGTTYYYRAYTAYTDATTNTPITSGNTTVGVVKVEWVADATLATELTTTTTGQLLFKGIENGTYELVETVAPEGYNKLSAPVTVKVGYDTNNTNLIDLGVNEVQNVENTSGTLLPSTGGLGTRIFILVGTLVAMGSGIILVTRLRMKKEAL